MEPERSTRSRYRGPSDTAVDPSSVTSRRPHNRGLSDPITDLERYIILASQPSDQELSWLGGECAAPQQGRQYLSAPLCWCGRHPIGLSDLRGGVLRPRARDAWLHPMLSQPKKDNSNSISRTRTLYGDLRLESGNILLSNVFTNHLQSERFFPRNRALATRRDGRVAQFGKRRYILTCLQARHSVPSTDDRLLLIILIKSVNHHASQVLVLFRTQQRCVALNAQVAAYTQTNLS